MVQHENPNNGRRSHITQAMRRQFYYYVTDDTGPGWSAARAARELGFSKATAYKMLHGYRSTIVGETARYQRDLPEPKTWDELGAGAQEALSDFLVFRRLYFARKDQVWAADVARELVEAITDRSERTFIDMNMFPGIGKTGMIRDLVVWLISGGGFCDPRRGRALRAMVGSRALRGAKHMCMDVRRPLELRRPYWDKEQNLSAEAILAVDFGRYRPDTQLGEESVWAADQFLVAQVGELDVYGKEPTVQAASQESGFLGERVDLEVWDDLATWDNSRNADQAREVAHWCETEAEKRVEPGGVFLLVGQRIGPLDLHRNRLDVRVPASEAEPEVLVPRYRHIVYPAHHDALCDGKHRQWDGALEGCLTDAWRLPVKDWYAESQSSTYRTVMQQEDTDPAEVLVRGTWIQGGDDEGYPAPGCLDKERAFGDHPAGVGKLVDYVSVDPSASNWWALEWWAYQPESRFNYLIWGVRRRMTAGQLLDWDNRTQSFTGHMQEMQTASALAGHPIRVWVIEANAAQRYLFQYEHYRRWRRAWPGVAVISHQTQGLNKLDPEIGVAGILPGRYKTGMKLLPYKVSGPEGPNFIGHLTRELTTYSLAEGARNIGFDTVMSDWIGEVNLPRIVQLSRRNVGVPLHAVGAKLPDYLLKQQHRLPMRQPA